MAYKSIGIIGGMGPAATCDLMNKIITYTDAADDQHHIHTYIDCNTNIPDRTDAILRGGESPVKELVSSGKKLQEMGADFLIMPCNTAHYFYDEITPHFHIPMLHMVQETGKVLQERGIRRAGVLATDGTIQSGAYKKGLSAFSIETVSPDLEHQKVIMSLIYDFIKHGITEKEKLPYSQVKEVLSDLSGKGAEIFILACTELPIAFEILGLTDHTIDPTLLLAKAAIRFAGAKVKEVSDRIG